MQAKPIMPLRTSDLLLLREVQGKADVVRALQSSMATNMEITRGIVYDNRCWAFSIVLGLE